MAKLIMELFFFSSRCGPRLMIAQSAALHPTPRINLSVSIVKEEGGGGKESIGKNRFIVKCNDWICIIYSLLH